jgi:hypothetical protein
MPCPYDFEVRVRVGGIRGYRENLYTAARIDASGCWCKEKSSTVRRRLERHPERSRARFCLSRGFLRARDEDEGSLLEVKVATGYIEERFLNCVSRRFAQRQRRGTLRLIS